MFLRLAEKAQRCVDGGEVVLRGFDLRLIGFDGGLDVIALAAQRRDNLRFGHLLMVSEKPKIV